MPNQNQTVQIQSKEVNYGFAPKKGSRTVPIEITFSGKALVEINLIEIIKLDILEFVQAVYCDNSANTQSFSITDYVSNQTLTWPAGSQGYLPFLTPTQSVFKCTIPVAGEPVVPIQLLSFPVPAFIWLPSSTIGAIVTVTGSQGVDGSTTIAVGGTAQNLFAGVTPVHGFAIYNPDAAEVLWVSDSTTAAANNTGSILVPANGGWYETPPNYKPIGAVSIVGATAGHKITARRW